LTDDQLNALSLVDPVAVADERFRRGAAETVSLGMTALAKAAFKLAHVVDGMKNTAATVAVKEADIVGAARRLIARLEIDGVDYVKPTLEDLQHGDE